MRQAALSSSGLSLAAPTAEETSAARVYGGLFGRAAAFLAFQLLLAALFAARGADDAWRRSADYWLVSLALGNMANLIWLKWAMRKEGRLLRELFSWRRAGIRRDLLWLVGVGLVSGVLASLPNPLLARALFGSAEAPAAMMFRPVAPWVAWIVLFAFPLLHGAAELPHYFGYVRPRLEALGHSRLASVVVCSLVLSAQHVVMPLLFDWSYLVWRGLMFLPFALWLGWALARRPTLLPWLAGLHVLLDASLPVFVLLASRAG